MSALADAGYARTDAGLLIPAQSLDRLHRTVLESEFVKFTRVLNFARENGMRAAFSCATCNQPIRMNHHDQIVTEITDAKGQKKPAGGGRLSLDCGCTTWQVR